MADFYEKGTVIELEIEGKKDILVYQMHSGKYNLFFNITPDSEEFGKRKIWDSGTKYFKTAVRAAKKIGRLNDGQIERVLTNRKYAKKILENLLK